MKRLFSQYALNVFQLQLDQWPYSEHTHNFYEIILVNQGTGRHILNKVSFDYHPGHVFLLTPEDYHAFDITSLTTFTYIKFTEQIFAEKYEGHDASHQTNQFKTILYNPNTTPACIVKDQEDRAAIFSLAKMLLKEFDNTKPYARPLMLELFGAMMVLVTRNLSQKNLPTKKIAQQDTSKIQRVLSHIRQNMDKKELLTQRYMADTFNLSPSYVSIYLKKHTGMGLQKMITETRLKTAEILLQKSDYTISQIATKVGFHDTSHMNKTFQKYRPKNPLQLRH